MAWGAFEVGGKGESNRPGYWSHRQGRAPSDPAGIEPVRFDWTDQGTYAAARKGVHAMYLVAAEDIAAVAAIALTEDGRGNGIVSYASAGGVGSDTSRRTARPSPASSP